MIIETQESAGLSLDLLEDDGFTRLSRFRAVIVLIRLETHGISLTLSLIKSKTKSRGLKILGLRHSHVFYCDHGRAHLDA